MSNPDNDVYNKDPCDYTDEEIEDIINRGARDMPSSLVRETLRSLLLQGYGPLELAITMSIVFARLVKRGVLDMNTAIEKTAYCGDQIEQLMTELGMTR